MIKLKEGVDLISKGVDLERKRINTIIDEMREWHLLHGQDSGLNLLDQFQDKINAK